MGKKLKILLVFISLSITLCLMSNTYSRYIASAAGNLQVLFAKWQILVNSTDITTNSSSSITLVPVMEEDSNIAANKIAPTSKGYFDVIIDPSNTDMSFNYSISLALNNQDIPDLLITKYAIIDSTTDLNDLTYTNVSGNTIDGTVNYTDANHAGFTVRIYFEWYDENTSKSDETDTTVGENAAKNNTSFEVNATMTFSQVVTPTSTPVAE